MPSKEIHMNSTLDYPIVAAASLAIAAIALTIGSAPASAQPTADEVEEITVKAPVVRRMVGGPAVVGATDEIIELNRRVSYSDLDLSKEADVAELETRIESVARDSCDQLSGMFPGDRWESRDIQRCTKQAVDGAEEQVLAAIAAAG